MPSPVTYWAVMLTAFVGFLSGINFLTDNNGMISLQMLWGGAGGAVFYAVLMRLTRGEW